MKHQHHYQEPWTYGLDVVQSLLFSGEGPMGDPNQARTLTAKRGHRRRQLLSTTAITMA